MGPEVKFKEAYASKIDSEPIWNRFDIDLETIFGASESSKLKMKA